MVISQSFERSGLLTQLCGILAFLCLRCAYPRLQQKCVLLGVLDVGKYCSTALGTGTHIPLRPPGPFGQQGTGEVIDVMGETIRGNQREKVCVCYVNSAKKEKQPFFKTLSFKDNS